MRESWAIEADATTVKALYVRSLRLSAFAMDVRCRLSKAVLEPGTEGRR
jgi:hypothetical protein